MKSLNHMKKYAKIDKIQNTKPQAQINKLV